MRLQGQGPRTGHIMEFDGRAFLLATWSRDGDCYEVVAQCLEPRPSDKGLWWRIPTTDDGFRQARRVRH